MITLHLGAGHRTLIVDGTRHELIGMDPAKRRIVEAIPKRRLGMTKAAPQKRNRRKKR